MASEQLARQPGSSTASIELAIKANLLAKLAVSVAVSRFTTGKNCILGLYYQDYKNFKILI
jgi:hypothetical protein